MMARRCMSRLGALIAALVVAGCGIHAPRPGPDGAAGSLLPLATGNEWRYDVRDARGESSPLTMRVRGEGVLYDRGKVATLVEESGGVPGESLFEANTDLVAYYRNDEFVFRSSWLRLLGAEVEEFGSQLVDERFLPLDPRRHPVWEARHGVFDTGSGSYYEIRTHSRLAGEGETVRVPAGRFDYCVRVESTVVASVRGGPHPVEITHHHVDWYQPGVGLVRSESFVETPRARERVVTAELTSYRVDP